MDWLTQAASAMRKALRPSLLARCEHGQADTDGDRLAMAEVMLAHRLQQVLGDLSCLHLGQAGEDRAELFTTIAAEQTVLATALSQ